MLLFFGLLFDWRIKVMIARWVVGYSLASSSKSEREETLDCNLYWYPNFYNPLIGWCKNSLGTFILGAMDHGGRGHWIAIYTCNKSLDFYEHILS